jgi:hypothetical protein
LWGPTTRLTGASVTTVAWRAVVGGAAVVEEVTVHI